MDRARSEFEAHRLDTVETLSEREIDIIRLIMDGFSNREIGQQLSLARETVKWYNKRIFSKLGVSNRTQAALRVKSLGLLDQVQGRATTPLPQVFSRDNLPAPVTSFVGRRDEISQVERLLEQFRLLTITGPAGSGKTRLALQVASEIQEQFSDGVFFIPLAPVIEVDNIFWLIAQHVDFQLRSRDKPLDQLLRYFREKSLLLIFDNFEHLLAGAEILIKILKAAPNVKILATSRENLNLYGEAHYIIGGLKLPDEKSAEDIRETESIELFIQRAQSVKSSFELRSDDYQHVGRICHLVEGMPLGIELAATWVDVLSLEEIADAIEQSLDILEAQMRGIGTDQNSMRAAFARSWKLLNEGQQAAFRRLSVFRGGFTRHAVESVAGVDLRTLQALVNKSLLQYDPNTGRYTVHELLRQYAREQLESSGEEAATHRNYAAYFADLMFDSWDRMKGQEQQVALHEIEVDFENVRAAWDYWIRERDVAKLKKFFHSFWVIHDIRGWYLAGIELFERGAAVMRALTSAEAVAGLGWLLAAEGLYSFAGGSGARKGFALAQEGVQILKRLGGQEDMVVPLIGLFITASLTNEAAVALEAAQECLELATRIGDVWAEAKAKQLLAIRAINVPDYALAEGLALEALDVFEAQGDNWSKSVLYIEVLGLLGISSRQFGKAKQWIEQGLEAAEKIDFKYSIQMAYWQLGFVAALEDDYPEAGKYWHRALRMGSINKGNAFIGFGGSSSTGEWGGRELIETELPGA